MPCPSHAPAPVTTRRVPLEVHPLTSHAPYRLNDAQYSTCEQCGMSWYERDQMLQGCHTPVLVGEVTTAVPAQGDC